MPDDTRYGIERWSEGYFSINDLGHVAVNPHRQGEEGDLFKLIQSLVSQGIEAPILIRFNGIIRDRITHIAEAFQKAIKEFDYRNNHRMVFPVKVNPQRHVVETIQQVGRDHEMGLEVGSKPELIAVLALETNKEMLLLCNGYKDAEYISLALMAAKLGRRILIIIEQAYELKLVLEAAEIAGVEAQIGFRMKLSSSGSGRWKSSGGEQSKFGLFSHEIVACANELRLHNKGHWLQLLHFHLGSQVTMITSIKKALKEASRMYTELASTFPSLCMLDVGGGLAVDYDGSKSDSDSSMNYTVEEYARDVISVTGEACLAAGIPDPLIVTETGRAIVSHHSVLITEVIDVTSKPDTESSESEHSHEILETLKNLEADLTLKNCRETFHDVMELKDCLLEKFVNGHLSLQDRASAEKKSRRLLAKIHTLYKELPYASEEFDQLDKLLLETYFCNFSVFQSLPDSWAIGQLFPIMPIHELNKKPTHQAVLADLTCDSDGKIDTFIGGRQPLPFINLHDYRGEPYYVGVFLVGAYQEILGGLHNLFGDTNVVHAELGANGEWKLSHLVAGDTIQEVLHYVQYNTEKLMEQLHEFIEKALKAGRITLQESAKIKKQFKSALESYTYLVV